MTVPRRALAPVIGAAVLGAVLALATMRSRPASTPTEPAAAGREISRVESSNSALDPTGEPAPARVATPGASNAAVEAEGTPALPPSSVSSTKAASTLDASATSAPRTVELTPITSADELHRVEMECDRKKLPESCERAARALDSGSAGKRDATRAAKLRRVALTLYVKQCESDRALACTRLAEMHEQGEMLQKNPRNAAALRVRVEDLCRLKPNQLGCQSEGPP